MSTTNSNPVDSTQRCTGFVFWAVLPDGRHNSISATNLIDAPRRARTLGAKELWVKNLASGRSARMM